MAESYLRSDDPAEFQKGLIPILMYPGFLRYSDLVAIKWQDIQFDEEVMRILIPHSKTDQAGHDTWIPIAATADPCCPVRCTRRFIQLAGYGPQ
ncbi:unnamed protein product [Closterium sp. NIES-54]